MHEFSELVYRSTISSLAATEETQKKIERKLQTCAATSLVKELQSIRMQKTILAVGMFSIFEAWLQNRLDSDNGFITAKGILGQTGNTKLLEKFIDLELANNVLKHGRGRSYKTLLAKNGGSLNVQILKPDEHFFNEGDVSEIYTLVNVDENFINQCVQVIDLVSEVIAKRCPRATSSEHP